MADQDRDNMLELDTLLGRGASFVGRLTFDGRTRVDGHLVGEVFSDGVLVLGESADVEATIEVKVLIVRGATLRGNVRATESIEVYAPARVYGSLAAPEVVIERGSVIEGSVHMGPLELA
ncbi:MAG: polymer-forming cytoskeletal protein [Deltaproteobacteria bacterium]|nr:polymer-forming cytoskeletal protein [Deltaproteobacteria bacterium]